MQVSISYFDQILGKKETQTRQVSSFAGIYFGNFVVFKILRVQNFAMMVKNRENLEI